MAKLKEIYHAIMLDYHTEIFQEGVVLEDLDELLGKSGMLSVWVSERLKPGMPFVEYTTHDMPSILKTSPGNIYIDGSILEIRTHDEKKFYKFLLLKEEPAKNKIFILPKISLAV